MTTGYIGGGKALTRVGEGLWTHRDFRRLWAAHTISQFGTQVTFLALPLLAIGELGAGPIEVALLGTLEFLPYLLIGLPAGVWVDRMRRRPIMIAADVARAVVLISVPVAWLIGLLSMPHLYVVGLLTGGISVFFDIASQSYLPSLIPAQRLIEGNAKLETSNAAAKVAGPSLAGALVQIIGAPVSIGADALSYLTSAAFLSAVRRSEASVAGASAPPPRRFWSELRHGLQFVRADGRLVALASSAAIGNVAAGIFDAVYLLYLVTEVGLEPATIGLVYGIGNAGLFAAALVVRRLAQRVDRRRLLIGSAATRATGFALAPLAALVATLPLLALGRALIAGSVMVYNVQQVSLRQTITPPTLLGRTNATIRFVSWGTIPIGMIGGGLIASVIGLWPTLWIGAAIGALAVIPLFMARSIRGNG